MTEQMKAAEEYLTGLPQFKKKPEIESVRAFYQNMGMPSSGIPVVHVAGTNGKGSVCCFLQSILIENGYHVGLFTSPHLTDVRERIRIDRELISEKDFLESLETVKKVLEKRQIPEVPCKFEFFYEMAMTYFEKRKPDLIILETGMGGRLDATNSFPHPVLSIITRIGLDHTQILGSTLTEIAGEKAGIIKKDAPLIFLDDDPEVTHVLRSEADRIGTTAIPVKCTQIGKQNVHDKGIDFSYDTGYYECKCFSLSAHALYQCENAAVAVQASAQLQKENIVSLKEQLVYLGLKNAFWEGRMEEILPGIYFDGAHNPDGIRAFLETVSRMKLSENGKRFLIFSVAEEKDYLTMMAFLRDSKLFSIYLLTPLAGSRKSREVGLLETCLGEQECRHFSSAEEAFEWCIRNKTEKDTVFAAGSLYLVGQLKVYLQNRKELYDKL